MAIEFREFEQTIIPILTRKEEKNQMKKNHLKKKKKKKEKKTQKFWVIFIIKRWEVDFEKLVHLAGFGPTLSPPEENQRRWRH